MNAMKEEMVKERYYDNLIEWVNILSQKNWKNGNFEN